MDLFIASMLILVLADDLLFLLVGWEGVGLSSYLLIGFWYQDPANGAAARKAFIVTRVGDTALLVGLLLIFTELGSLNIQEVMGLAQAEWAQGAAVATAAALLILGGALGKSAQLPLQTWLPDAMAGPTPVSALIHAATMVTAGVYLVARTHVLFDLAPAVRLTVAIIGAITLLYAGLSALAQTDIKRVLAYSTISQVGYMFLALGVAAWSAAILHFLTHAFFKALLFLAAGLVIKALGGEHDIRKMGGLRREDPCCVLAVSHRGRLAVGATAGHRGLLQQGPDPGVCLDLRAWQRVAVAGRRDRSPTHLAVRVPSGVRRVLRPPHADQGEARLRLGDDSSHAALGRGVHRGGVRSTPRGLECLGVHRLP